MKQFEFSECCRNAHLRVYKLSFYSSNREVKSKSTLEVFKCQKELIYVIEQKIRCHLVITALQLIKLKLLPNTFISTFLVSILSVLILNTLRLRAEIERLPFYYPKSKRIRKMNRKVMLCMMEVYSQ